MAFHQRPQVVNPLLGIYFGIFAACQTGIVVLLLIFEQLGTAEGMLRMGLLATSLGLFAGIGIAAYTAVPREFLLSGRRVPAAFNGLVVALAAIGGTGLVAFTGALFLIGFDALCLALGVIAGLVVMVMLIAPYLRKFGAATVPGYLGARFESTTVRLAAAGIAAAPLLLLLVAELKVAVMAAVWLTQGAEATAAWIIAVALVAMLVPGGVRSASWSSVAQSIAALIAVLVPAAIVAVMVTNLPLGQLSHGPVLRALGRIEAAQAVPTPAAGQLLMDLPGQALQAISGRFATPFGSVGSLAFVLAVLAIMAGIAGSPALLARAATTPTVYEARKSIGWSVFVAGIMVMTMSTVAVLLRDFLMDHLMARELQRLPAVMKPLIDAGLAALDGGVKAGSTASVLFKRDGVLLALPIAMGLPAVLVHLVATGILAAALAGAGVSLMQLALVTGEDVINGPRSELHTPLWRLMIVRGATAALAALAAWLAVAAPGDPLDLMLWSLALSGSSLFPVLLLSVWWKRINAWGALAGLSMGFLLAAAGLLAGMVEATRLPVMMMPAVAAPLAVGAALVTSLLTPAPGRHVLEMVRDLRIPGGETVHDREARLALQRERQRQAG